MKSWSKAEWRGNRMRRFIDFMRTPGTVPSRLLALYWFSWAWSILFMTINAFSGKPHALFHAALFLFWSYILWPRVRGLFKKDKPVVQIGPDATTDKHSAFDNTAEPLPSYTVNILFKQFMPSANYPYKFTINIMDDKGRIVKSEPESGDTYEDGMKDAERAARKMIKQLVELDKAERLKGSVKVLEFDENGKVFDSTKRS